MAPIPEGKVVETFGPNEKDRSLLALQQWIQKVEYVLRQKEMIEKNSLAIQERTRKAVCAAERRQDGLSGFPGDYLRHWRQASTKGDKVRLFLQTSVTWLNAGVCCLPQCCLFFTNVALAKTAEPRWEREEAEANAAWEAEEEAEWAEYMANNHSQGSSSSASQANSPDSENKEDWADALPQAEPKETCAGKKKK